jgi:chromosome segregation ATPase
MPIVAQRKKPASLAPPAVDLETDARVLADYGDPPGSPVLTPMYAWRVFKRQRELKVALAVRAAEAEHARTTYEDAMVALAERARPVAEKQQGYRANLDDLTRVEEQLRSRDKVLAAEQDAQRARLAQVEGRIEKAESELAKAQGLERAVATELSGVQGGLAREEAKIKRAETELRAAQQREGSGGALAR